MSMEYCEECDKMIDLDIDSEHEHFEEINEVLYVRALNFAQ